MEKNNINMSLFEKISRIREEFYLKPVKKSGENKFSGFKYFELSDILPVTIPILAKYKVSPIVSFNKEFAEMTIYDGESEQNIKIQSPSVEVKLKGCIDVQNLGAEQTYQRRYLWLAFLEVAENDEIDQMTGAQSEAKMQPPKKEETPEAKIKNLIKLKIKEKNILPETFERILNEEFNLSTLSYKNMNLQALENLYKILGDLK